MRLLSDKNDVLPDLKEDYYLRTPGGAYFKVVGVDMLGQFKLALASRASPLAVGGKTDFEAFTTIEPRDSKDKTGPMEFYNIAVGVRGPGKVHIKHPAGSPIMGSNDSPDGGVLTRRNSNWLDPRASMWIHEDAMPQFQLENDYNVPIWAWVYVQGMKYAVRTVCDNDTIALLNAKSIPSEPIRFGGIENTGGAL